jgi:hypothetical protein
MPVETNSVAATNSIECFLIPFPSGVAPGCNASDLLDIPLIPQSSIATLIRSLSD